jgi:hypothetical protein
MALMGTIQVEENETGARVDHRRLRTVQTHAKIMACCRHMMASGDIRPETAAIAKAAHCSLRTIFQHFSSLNSLYEEAADDADTAGAVLSHALGEDWRVAGIPERWVNRLACAIVGGLATERLPKPGRSSSRRR